MSNKNKCDICNKEFKDLKKHKNRKIPCKPKNNISILNVEDDKNTFVNIFKVCFDILRNDEGITGIDALKNISYLLVLKLIEPHIGKDIDIDNYEYNFENYFEDSVIENNKKKLLRMVRFSNLSKEPDDNIVCYMKYLWNIILSEHPSTKNIFLKGKCFDIKHKTKYVELIDKLSYIDMSNTEQDILGNAYEEAISTIMVGKTLGQFFTPPFIKNIMIDLIKPVLYQDGTIESCCDPAMGTGGFLITYIRYIIEEAKKRNIKLNWNDIKKSIYGKEIEPSTYQLSLSNMLISSGYMFEQLENGDSVRNPIDKKFDNVMANPPFGLRIKYNSFSNTLKNIYTPIETDNGTLLFLQLIIYILKVGGKATIVLPDGQEFFSKTNRTFIIIREYLLKTCDLKEIIYIPSGMFTNTSIKTCIFYFEKKKECDTTLKVIIKETKNKEKREYKFIDDYQTKNTKFYCIKENKKELLVNVSIKKIIENKFSLNYMEYLEKKDIKENKNIEINKLGEIGTFLTKSKRQASYGEKKGDYPFYTSSQTCTKYCREYDYEEESLIIGTGGNANIKYDKKFSCSSDNFVIKINNEYLTKYVYYYLLNNIDILENGFNGLGIKHISKEYIKNIVIPIPSIDYQKQIIEKLDCLNEISYNSTIKNLKKQNNIYISNNEKNNIKKLGEICGINQGTLLTKLNMNNDGKYNVIGGGKIIGNHDEKNRDGNEFVLTRVGDLNINFMNTSYYLTDNGFSVKSNDENIILTKYIYYFCLYNKKLINELYNGTAQKVISKTVLKMIDISIPLLDKQKQIVEFCENNDSVIKLLEKNIENNKNLSKQIIDNITI